MRLWIDVARSALRALPWSLRRVAVRWNGMQVPDRVAFGDPDDIGVAEIVGEPNLAYRSVLLERVGLDWLVDHARAAVVDRDLDAGGERRLLRIPFAGGEDVTCVEVRCPTTGHRYVLRVPPQMQTCRQAVAWTAGFSNPSDYQPVAET